MYTTPGIYFEQADQGRPAVGTLRTDIAGFVGYTERGPLLAPVKIGSWRQFTAVFGPPLSFAYLGEAVRGFFDNGGRACYVARVADPDTAAAARLQLPGANGAPTLELVAKHGELGDPKTGRPQVEDGRPVRYVSPGAWGNRLAIQVAEAGLGSADSWGEQPADGQTTRVDSLSGFEVGSVVRIVQEGHEATLYRRVREIAPHLQQLRWDAALSELALDLARPFRLETVEFTLTVLLDGQIAETHANLSLAADHGRYVTDLLQRNSVYLDARVLVDQLMIGQPGLWPAAVAGLPLLGGRDGLTKVTRGDFLAALDTLAKVDEVSLLAAPDVVLQASAPLPGPAEDADAVNCESLDPLPSGRLQGVVVRVAEEGATEPLTGVTIQALGTTAAPVTSAAGGQFQLEDLPEGHVSLRLEKAGFYGLETTAQAHAGVSEPVTLVLTSIALPPSFSHDDIAAIQAAMARQGEQGLYRVALLDPPADMLKLEAIRTWRTRFDTAFGALYYPWLLVGDGDGVRSVPPSGHVAGLIAHTDRVFGVHRAPANVEVAGVKALSESIDDTAHGILNPLGVNCLRVRPGRGIRVEGARTLSSDGEWRYLNVRRLLLMIEEAVEEANQWAVFEPNNPLLRQILTYGLNSFLDTLWKQGALAGATPAAAYQVKCDVDNNPASVADVGQIIAEVAVAPAVPFEFIKFRLGRTVEALTVTE